MTACDWVHAGCRLVEEDDGRVANQRNGRAQLALVSAAVRYNSIVMVMCSAKDSNVNRKIVMTKTKWSLSVVTEPKDFSALQAVTYMVIFRMHTV